MPSPLNFMRPQPSKRSTEVKPFEVMRVLHAAVQLEADSPPNAPPILHLEIGQPTSCPPPSAISSATYSLTLPASSQGYTAAPGIYPLRAALSTHYSTQYSLSLSPSSILLTTGASGAFPPLFATLFDPFDHVALAIPGYPCYRHVLSALSVTIVPIHVTSSTNFQPSLEQVQTEHAKHPLKGLILASPSNPTGATLTEPRLEELANFCKQEGIWLVSDEIYHGISRQPLPTAAKYLHAVVVSSFSKYWCMPGFRIGWVVIQDTATRTSLENALQSMAICAPTLSQHAALGALSADCAGLLKNRAERYLEAADGLVKVLKRAGFEGVERPQGAIYVWAGCRGVCEQMGVRGSVELCGEILKRARVAVTPGVDFDPWHGNMWVRFSCADVAGVEEAGRRILQLMTEKKEG